MGFKFAIPQFLMSFIKVKIFKNTKKDVVQLLIDILHDKSAREDERHDAVMDLSDYPDIRALNALFDVASNPKEEIIIIDSAAESIAEIFIKLDYFDEEKFKKLGPFAQKVTYNYVKSHKPTLISKKLEIEYGNNDR